MVQRKCASDSLRCVLLQHSVDTNTALHFKAYVHIDILHATNCLLKWVLEQKHENPLQQRSYPPNYDNRLAKYFLHDRSREQKQNWTNPFKSGLLKIPMPTETREILKVQKQATFPSNRTHYYQGVIDGFQSKNDTKDHVNKKSTSETALKRIRSRPLSSFIPYEQSRMQETQKLTSAVANFKGHHSNCKKLQLFSWDDNMQRELRYRSNALS